MLPTFLLLAITTIFGAASAESCQEGVNLVARAQKSFSGPPTTGLQFYQNENVILIVPYMCDIQTCSLHAADCSSSLSSVLYTIAGSAASGFWVEVIAGPDEGPKTGCMKCTFADSGDGTLHEITSLIRLDTYTTWPVNPIEADPCTGQTFSAISASDLSVFLDTRVAPALFDSTYTAISFFNNPLSADCPLVACEISSMTTPVSDLTGILELGDHTTDYEFKIKNDQIRDIPITVTCSDLYGTSTLTTSTFNFKVFCGESASRFSEPFYASGFDFYANQTSTFFSFPHFACAGCGDPSQHCTFNYVVSADTTTAFASVAHSGIVFDEASRRILPVSQQPGSVQFSIYATNDGGTSVFKTNLKIINYKCGPVSQPKGDIIASDLLLNSSSPASEATFDLSDHFFFEQADVSLCSTIQYEASDCSTCAADPSALNTGFSLSSAIATIDRASASPVNTTMTQCLIATDELGASLCSSLSYHVCGAERVRLVDDAPLYLELMQFEGTYMKSKTYAEVDQNILRSKFYIDDTNCTELEFVLMSEVAPLVFVPFVGFDALLGGENGTTVFIWVDASKLGSFYVSINTKTSTSQPALLKIEYKINRPPPVFVVPEIVIEEPEVVINITEPLIGVEEEPEVIELPPPPPPEGFTARIASISTTGEVEIIFSEEVIPVAHDSINSTNLELYVSPSYSLVPTFNLSTLNFTWEPTAQAGRSLKLQLTFQNPEVISPKLDQDSLIITFENPELFETQGGLFLKPESRVIKRRLPVQMANNMAAKSLKSGASSAETSMGVMLIGFFVLNLVLSGAMRYMLVFLNSLMLIIHLPIMQVVMPANVSTFSSYLLSVVSFDVLPSEKIAEAIFDFDEEMRDELAEGRIGQLADLGYETHNSILNLGSIGLYLLAYFAQVLLVALPWWAIGMKQVLMRKTTSHLFFSDLLSLVQEGYMELLMAALLNYGIQNHSTNGEAGAKWLGLLCLALSIIVFPAVILWITFQPLKKLREKAFKRRWGELYSDLKMNRLALLSLPLFVLRRCAFISNSFLLSGVPLVQIQVLLLLNLLSSAYVLHALPFKQLLLNRMEIGNEIGVSAASYILLIFTDWGPSETMKAQIGWVKVGLVTTLIFANLSIIIKEGLISLRASFYKVKQAIKDYLNKPKPLPPPLQIESETCFDIGSSHPRKMTFEMKYFDSQLANMVPLKLQRFSFKRRLESKLSIVRKLQSDQASPKKKKKVAARMKKQSFSFRDSFPQVHAEILDPQIDFSKRTPALKASKLTLNATVSSFSNMPFREQMTAIPAILDCFLMMEPWVAYQPTLRNPKASALSKQLSKLSSQSTSQVLEQLLATTHIKRVMNFQVLDPYKVFHLFAGLTAIDVQESPFQMTISHSFKCLNCEDTEVVEANSMALALDVPNEPVDVEDLLEDSLVGKARTIRRCSSCQALSLQQHAQFIVGEPEILAITLQYKEPSRGKMVGGVQMPEGHLMTQEPLALSLAAEEEVPLFFVDSCQSWKSKQVPSNLNFIDGFLKQKGFTPSSKQRRWGPPELGFSAREDRRPAFKRAHLPPSLYLPSSKFNLCSWIKWTGRSYSAMKPPQPGKSVVVDNADVAFYTIE